MTYDELLVQIDGLLATEDSVDLDAIDAVVAALRTTARPRTPGERDVVATRLHALQQRARTELGSLGETLRTIGSSRKALRAYGHMRSNRTSQSADRHG